jgi:hypothetical protein
MTFDYGDTVRVTDTADPSLRPGEAASVVGLPQGDDEPYLVEFGDGQALEVPQAFLELVGDSN